MSALCQHGGYAFPPLPPPPPSAKPWPRGAADLGPHVVPHAEQARQAGGLTVSNLGRVTGE